MGKGVFKFFTSILFANAIRLLKFIPNNDPIMALLLPFSKQDGLLKAILFPISTMVSFDLVTGLLGVWTIVTAGMYGVLGAVFYFYFRRKESVSMKHYLGLGVVGVLVFDFVTGVLASPFMFGITFEQAFIGQIPFTTLHLLTVSGFVVVLVPLLDRFVVQNKNLEDSKIWAVLQRKATA